MGEYWTGRPRQGCVRNEGTVDYLGDQSEREAHWDLAFDLMLEITIPS